LTERFGQAVGGGLMYRDRKRNAGVTDWDDTDWQDWPADTSPKSNMEREIERAARAPQGAPEVRREQPAPSSVPAAFQLPAKVVQGAGAKDAPDTKRPRHPVRTIVLAATVLAALGLGGWYGHYWWTTGRYLISTDDAYVGAKNTTLSAKIMGYVAEVAVDDNARVRNGDVIARIDDGDYQLAAETARDNIATQQATVDRIGKQVTAQQASVDQAKAQLASAEAGATRADLELKRQQDLASRNFASRQTLEQAQANRDQSVAAVQGGQAALESAQANVDVLKAQQVEAMRTLDQLRTALAKAERDLSFTVIRAPFDGVMGNRAMQVGDLVQPGQRLASLVPLEAIYVDANFKETQLADIKPGQPVSVAVDAYSDHKITGTVVSLAPASGSVFSLLPPDNATGNFTKIVQRVPVRIAVPAAVAEQGMLRPGMSVVVSVDTKPGAVGATVGQNAQSLARVERPRNVGSPR
jgi:membrane fusion protein (multidrug efflux system)